MPASFSRSSRKAFSLLELVLVIGLLALLMTLMGSVWSKVQRATDGTRNLQNHRVLAAALIAFAADHRGSLPAVYVGGSDKLSYTRQLVLDGYLADPRVIFSPRAGKWYQKHSGVLARPDARSIVPWFYTNYGANRYGAMPYGDGTDGSRHPANLTRVGDAGHLNQLMLLRDVYDASYDRPESESTDRGGGRVWFAGAGYYPTLERTFGGKVHASFADGHVEAFDHGELRQRLLSASDGQPPLFNNLYTRPPR